MVRQRAAMLLLLRNLLLVLCLNSISAQIRFTANREEDGITEILNQIGKCKVHATIQVVNDLFDVICIYYLESQSKTTTKCPCVAYDDCSLASRTLKQMETLRRNNPTYRRGVRIFQSLVCDAVTQKIRCCTLEDDDQVSTYFVG